VLRRDGPLSCQLHPGHTGPVSHREHQALSVAPPRPLLRGLRLGRSRRRRGVPAGCVLPLDVATRSGALRRASAGEGGDTGARRARGRGPDLLRYRLRMDAL
ncbi:hypothetical protein AVDCRST_MAG82-867, partial [uncultured Rubrobacteraceae bacterium]